MLFTVVGSCGWYLLIPFIVFLLFVFVPDWASNWLINNEYKLLRWKVELRLYIQNVRKNLINSINVSLISNTFTYEYR